MLPLPLTPSCTWGGDSAAGGRNQGALLTPPPALPPRRRSGLSCCLLVVVSPPVRWHPLPAGLLVRPQALPLFKDWLTVCVLVLMRRTARQEVGGPTQVARQVRRGRSRTADLEEQRDEQVAAGARPHGAGASGVSELRATGTPSSRWVVRELALGSPGTWMVGEGWAETAGTHHGRWEHPLRAVPSLGLVCVPPFGCHSELETILVPVPGPGTLRRLVPGTQGVVTKGGARTWPRQCGPSPGPSR